MKAWTEATTSIEIYRAQSGWIIRRRAFDVRVAGEDIAGLSDDQALLEFFAEQLALPAHKLSATEASDELVRHMVDRFLSWRLPDSFEPDGGITFEPVANEGTPYAYTHEPTGTNLFEVTQADAMVRHMLGGLDDNLPGPPPNPRAEEASAAAIVPPPVSRGEAEYAKWRGSLDAEFDGTKEDLARARDMFEKWIGDALPANDDGQVHFGRALAESMSDAIGAFLKREDSDVALDDTRTVHAVREALGPFEAFAIVNRSARDGGYFAIDKPDDVENYASISYRQLRDLLRAAGLFTDEMRPSQPQAADASVKPAEGATSPPADADEGGGCPFDDPDCMSRSDECHDACQRPRAVVSDGDPL